MAVANPIFPSYLSFLSVARELVIGTAIVGTSTIPLDPSSYEPEDTPHFLPDEAIRGSMVHLYNEILGVEDATFTYGGPVYLDNDGFFFDNVFGDLSTTGVASGTGQTTIATASVIGQTSGTVASSTNFFNNNIVQIDSGALAEVVTLSTNGAGGVLTFANNPLRFPHTVGATVFTVTGPYTHKFNALNSGTGQPPTHCVDMTTEILTRNGWKTAHDLCVGDEALTLNHLTGMSEWNAVEEVCIFPALTREMVSMEGRGHSSLSTPNHRWPVTTPYKSRTTGENTRTWRTTETLKVNDKIPIAAPCADLPTEPKYTDAFVELVAWYFTEGDTPTWGNYRITQALCHADNVERIDKALRNVIGPPVENLSYASVPEWRRRVEKDIRGHSDKIRFILNSVAGQMIMEVAPNRIVSHEFILSLTKAQLDLFITVAMLGDNNGPKRLVQKDYAMAEAFQFAVTLAGHGTSILKREWDVEKWPTNPNPAWNVTIQSRKNITPVLNVKTAEKYGAGWKIEHIKHEGEVWCPRTANMTWYARRNGQCYFTGNTLVDYQGITAVTGARAYVSACVATLDFTGNAEQLLSWKVSGSSWISAVSATKPTAQSAYVVPIPNWRGIVTVGGGTINNIGEWSISLKRPLKIYWTAQNSQNPFFIARGPLDCVGTLNYTVATDETPLTLMLNNTQPALNIAINNGVASTLTTFLSFNFNANQAAYVKAKVLRNSELVGFQTEFQTVANATNVGGSGGLGPATVTVVNNTPTY